MENFITLNMAITLKACAEGREEGSGCGLVRTPTSAGTGLTETRAGWHSRGSWANKFVLSWLRGFAFASSPVRWEICPRLRENQARRGGSEGLPLEAPSKPHLNLACAVDSDPTQIFPNPSCPLAASEASGPWSPASGSPPHPAPGSDLSTHGGQT